MRKLVTCLCGIALLAAATEHPTARQYRRAAINKQAGIRAGAHAAYGTLRNSPHEWGRGPGGFAKRAGSALGQHALKGTIQLGVGAWHHENLHYQRSNLQGKWPRLKYAVKSTFIVPRTGNRKGKTVAVGRVAGNMGAGMISRVWQPASAAGVGAGVASGGIGLGADVGANVAREFWPRKHKKHLKRRRKS
jgi:hypothetical protein